jgi:DNA-binding NtrC family response regulator
MNPLALQGLNILVVDDDPRVRGLYVMALQEAGATVTASGAATEAVQFADLYPPDVVVTDLRMPEHDGVWLLQELKRRMRAVPVIVVTGGLDALGREDLLSLGFAETLRKPLALPHLVTIIARAAGRAD